jgi:hypothetical protein
MSEDQPPVVEAEPSLHETLANAFEAVAPAGDAPGAPADDPAAAERSAGPARDERGRFAQTEQSVHEPSEPPPPAGGQEPPRETIRPPASWSATAKSRFATLDPVIQQEVLKREKDIETGKAQWDQKGERLNRLDAVLAPRRDRLRLMGWDDARAIEALFAAQDLLERDPMTGLGYLARQYGVDLSRLAPGGPEQAAQPPMHPAVQRLAQQVTALEGALAAQQSAARQGEAAKYDAEVAAFRADPSNLYLDDVADDMSALLRSGRASTLKDAYDKAVWANPETRTLLINEREDQRRAEAEQARRTKANAARYASGSITGSPQPGSSPANAGPAPTLRDELTRAFSDAS